jgi:hypothetical protein
VTDKEKIKIRIIPNGPWLRAGSQTVAPGRQDRNQQAFPYDQRASSWMLSGSGNTTVE